MRGLNNGLDLLLEWFLILLDIEMYTKSSLEPQNLDQLGFPCITTSRGLREHQGRQAMPAELPIPDSVALRYPRTVDEHGLPYNCLLAYTRSQWHESNNLLLVSLTNSYSLTFYPFVRCSRLFTINYIDSSQHFKPPIHINHPG